LIETERLRFRKYTVDDLDFLAKMTSNPEMMKYIGSGKTWNEPETKERLQRFISRNNSGDDLGLMVATRISNGKQSDTLE
jgi:RimJ/RimL family protein N-acetyltransferase